MAQYYLRYSDGTYSDFGKYKRKPADRDDGTWVLGEPLGLELKVFRTPDQLIEEDFLKLPVSEQAEMMPLLSQGLLALQRGNTDLVTYLTNQASTSTESKQSFVESVKNILGASV